MSAFDAPTSIPCFITAGEAVTWTEFIPDYTSATYGVSYLFAGTTPQDGFQQFIITGSGSGTSWTFATATSYKPGIYYWEKKITRTSDSVIRVIETGQITIRPSFSAVPTVTSAAAMLTALNTAITTLTTTVNQSVSFNGQSYTKASLADLLGQRTRLQAEVYRENQAAAALNGVSANPRVAVRFVPNQPGPFGNIFIQ